MEFRTYLNNVSAVEIADGVTVTIQAKNTPAFVGNAADTIDFLQRLGVGHSVEIRHDLGVRSCMNKPALWESITFLGRKPEDTECCKWFALSDESGFIGINKTQRLFVIRHNDYYSTLGFDYAAKQTRALYAWLGKSPAYFDSMVAQSAGSLRVYEMYQEAMKTGADYAKTTGKRCDANLTPALIGLEGKRVAIVNADGSEESRFRVGKSTGWMPCHLEIMPRQDGGGSVHIPDGATVKVLD